MSEGGVNKPRALVTGATGFLGRPLCEKLQSAGFKVRGAARIPSAGPWSEFIQIDLPSNLPDGLVDGIDIVFHLAGRAHAVAASRDYEALHRQVNTLGTEEIARRAKAAGVRRFVLMSSVKAMGEPGDTAVPEDHPATATDPYGLSKREAEAAVMALQSASFEVVVLRPVLVYGPGVKGNLDSVLQLLRGGRMPPLPRINNRRSMVGVNDLVDATLVAGCNRNTGGKTYTVTDGNIYSTTDIVAVLAAAAGITRPARIVLPVPVLRLGARVGDAYRRVSGRRLPLDSDVLRRLLGNAEYEATHLRRDTGFRPRETLSDVAPDMVHRRDGPR